MKVRNACILVLAFLVPGNVVVAQTGLSWLGVDEALQVAQRTDRPVLVYVSAPWCALCHRVEKDVIPSVAGTLDGFVPARVQFDDDVEPAYRGFSPTSAHRWLRSIGIDAPPAFVLLEPDGSIVTAAAGFLKPRELSTLLAFVKSGAYRSMHLEEYLASSLISR